MFRFLSGVLFITAALIFAYLSSPIPFYRLPKQTRLYNVWKEDLNKLSLQKDFKNVFNNISKIEVHFTDPQVAEEFTDFKTPIHKGAAPQGYTLKIGITRWIEKNNYGFVIQHELFDLNDDKIYEFGRTYKIGLIF